MFPCELVIYIKILVPPSVIYFLIITLHDIMFYKCSHRVRIMEERKLISLLRMYDFNSCNSFYINVEDPKGMLPCSP